MSPSELCYDGSVMPRLILVCGPTGSGKTTYARKISEEIGGIRFSIDPWMKNLFEKDLKSLDFEWISERVERCQTQIWEVCQQILRNKGHVVLDLSFSTKRQRSEFFAKAEELGIQPELHVLDVPVDIRKQRVQQRNEEKDPAVYAFEVTDFMFDFMEPKFEVPGDDELVHGRRI